MFIHLPIVASVRKRVHQGVHALRPDPLTSSERGQVRSVLSPAQTNLFLGMSDYEQRHALRTYRCLADCGVNDRDLLVAALLHDVGKARSDSSVRVVDRALVVLCDGLSPTLLDRMLDVIPERLLQDIHHLRSHADRGAALVRAAGGSERTCWLVAMHGRDADFESSDLLLLQDADSAS